MIMNVYQNILVLIIITLHLVEATVLVHGSTYDERKPYIVYMGESPEAHISAVDQHHNLLLSAIGEENVARKSRIYSYVKSFNGFAARLLPHEAKRLSDEDGVISVFKSTQRKLHTTRSWDFLGMTETLKRNYKLESNIIVGVLDTGIYMESPSFNGEGYGPAPARWKGKCQKGGNFTGCNNKVIGAKYFNLDNTMPAEDPTPADEDGHGTHTASTIAGVPVKGANVYGVGKGTARGGVPSARIAMYKVCWGTGCSDVDLLAGFDDAIADGVDLISVSIGGTSRSFFQDPIAIGSFHAMKKGILTSCSGGNEGPSTFTVQNVAPWILTVAASSIDRKFESPVKLHNGKNFSVSPVSVVLSLMSFILNCFLNKKRLACDYGTLGMDKVKGKIVFCLGNNGQDSIIKELGGAGTILVPESLEDIAFIPLIPGTSVSINNGKRIDQYINSTKYVSSPIIALEST
ncbi:subtilase family protein [Tripterygium wilfordii]|uniref:Subtilase family protein n=1 Tax=Tripterygium wilfordii TaxID=458696 RepID=A0A7J7DWG0_TRIWF|nr:subtilase family protein [Tripterygium wilfordii]